MTAAAHVQAEAARLGVALSTVKGTGAGGRISLADVRAAAGQSRRPVSAPSGPTARMRPMGSPWGGGVSVEVDDFDTNPFVIYVKATNPAAGFGPAPTMFASGNVPPVTASGADPEILRRVPWQIRHAAAAATSLVELYGMLELPVEGVLLEFGVDAAIADRPPGVLERGELGLNDYRQRVWNWATAEPMPPEMTDDELAALFNEDQENDR